MPVAPRIVRSTGVSSIEYMAHKVRGPQETDDERARGMFKGREYSNVFIANEDGTISIEFDRTSVMDAIRRAEGACHAPAVAGACCFPVIDQSRCCAEEAVAISSNFRFLYLIRDKAGREHFTKPGWVPGGERKAEMLKSENVRAALFAEPLGTACFRIALFKSEGRLRGYIHNKYFKLENDVQMGRVVMQIGKINNWSEPCGCFLPRFLLA